MSKQNIYFALLQTPLNSDKKLFNIKQIVVEKF